MLSAHVMMQPSHIWHMSSSTIWDPLSVQEKWLVQWMNNLLYSKHHSFGGCKVSFIGGRGLCSVDGQLS